MGYCLSNYFCINTIIKPFSSLIWGGRGHRQSPRRQTFPIQYISSTAQYCVFARYICPMSIKSNIFPWYDLLMESDNVLRIDRRRMDGRWSERNKEIYGSMLWSSGAHILGVEINSTKIEEEEDVNMTKDTDTKPKPEWNGSEKELRANSINVWANYCFYASFVNINEGWGVIIMMP